MTPRPYFLTTPRLGFGLWSEPDLPLALALWTDPRVTRLIGGPFTEARVRERLAKEIESQEASGIQYWPLFLLEDASFVGCCGLRPTPEPGVLELGFHLLPGRWGKGYGRESAEAAVAFAFERKGAEALFAGHHPENADSRRLLGRLGFSRAGTQFYPPTGLDHPAYRLSEAAHARGRARA